MTVPRLDDIRARLQQATPGKWELARWALERGPYSVVLPATPNEMPREIAAVRHLPTARFLASAPEDIAFLLALVEKLQDESEQRMVQLAGVSTAALGGTRDPATREMYGWSVAYQDTLELRMKYDAMRKAIQDALHELGVPQPGYPAPVANAVEILRAALVEGREGGEGVSASADLPEPSGSLRGSDGAAPSPAAPEIIDLMDALRKSIAKGQDAALVEGREP